MKKQQIKAGVASLIVGLMAPLAVVAPHAHAGTRAWTGFQEETDKLWSNTGNWYLGMVGADGDDLQFGVVAHSHEVDLDSDVAPNTITFQGERTEPSSKSYRIFSTAGHTITVTASIEAIMTGTGGDHAIETDVTLGGNATFRTTGSNTLAIGDTGKTLNLGANTLTLDASGGTITILGKIEGSGAITKSGTGKVKILATPGTGGFTSTLSVSAGETTVEDNLGLNVTVAGGKLKGTGTVGDVSMSSGSVAPGLSPGVINTGDITFTGGTFEAELGGTASGQFDQTNVTGTVNLGSATTLTTTLVNSFAPALNNSFVIINNDGTDAVTGTFSGVANGASITVSGYTFRVNYDGGTDNNDVVLTVTAVPSTATTPNTGIGSLITNPFVTLAFAFMTIGTIGAIRYAEVRKK